MVILKNKYYKKTINVCNSRVSICRSSGDQNQPSTMMFGVTHCPICIGEMRVNDRVAIGL